MVAALRVADGDFRDWDTIDRSSAAFIHQRHDLLQRRDAPRGLIA